MLNHSYRFYINFQIYLAVLGLSVFLYFGYQSDIQVTTVCMGIMFLVMANGVAIKICTERIRRCEEFCKGIAELSLWLANQPDHATATKLTKRIVKLHSLVSNKSEIDKFDENTLLFLANLLGADNKLFTEMVEEFSKKTKILRTHVIENGVQERLKQNFR